MKKIVKEFQEFIARGNVVDLAVGVIMGSAFGKIVTSIVDDILLPILGALLGGINFSGLSVQIGEANVTYGNFLQNVIDFLIVAFCIFLMVKAINSFLAKSKELMAAEKEKTDTAEKEQKQQAAAMKSLEEEEVALLREIRDSLKKS